MKKTMISLISALTIFTLFTGCGGNAAQPEEGSGTGPVSSSDEAGPLDGASADLENSVSYEGTVVSIEFDKTEDGSLKGRLEMTDAQGGNPYIFNFDGESTAFEVDAQGIQQGDALLVEHSPVSTRSLPPQSAAYRISAIQADTAPSSGGSDAVTVEGADVFRGTVLDFAVNDAGETVLQMAPAEGTGFPYPFSAALKSDTQYGGRGGTEFGNGSFLEVYYKGGTPNADGSFDALVVSVLESEQAVYYNGTLMEIQSDGEQGKLMLSLDGGTAADYIFNYGEQTEFIAPLDSLKPGDKLNIYHAPMAALSLPPQSAVLEVRLYTETDGPDQTQILG